MSNITLKLVKIGKGTQNFFSLKSFVPKGFSAPVLGVYTYTTMKYVRYQMGVNRTTGFLV